VQKTLLTVPHLHQLSDGDCLAACAAMVLAYYEVSIDYPDLLQILKIKSFGAPARNIKHLESLGGLKVSYRSTDMTGLKEMLLDGKPVIVFIRTSELPYWNYETDHAIVIVGFNEDNIFANDPHFDHSPIEIPRGDFELAWLERDYYYGFVERIISE
jgi:ABC-type bacteriocin/lantibiotic exporter with double-glycine peptidase domain